MVYDGVLGPWLLPKFVRAAGLRHIHYVILLPPLALCLERVRLRVDHGFSDLSVTRHLYDQFANAAVETRHLITEQVIIRLSWPSRDRRGQSGTPISDQRSIDLQRGNCALRLVEGRSSQCALSLSKGDLSQCALSLSKGVYRNVPGLSNGKTYQLHLLPASRVWRRSHWRQGQALRVAAE